MDAGKKGQQSNCPVAEVSIESSTKKLDSTFKSDDKTYIFSSLKYFVRVAIEYDYNFVIYEINCIPFISEYKLQIIF